MHQCRTLHQLIVGLPHLKDFERIIHMVNVEHHQSVQVTVCQSTMTEHPALGRSRFVKLIAREYERSQVVLELLSKGQQPLFVTLLKEFLAS